MRITSMNRMHTVDIEAPIDTGVACTTLSWRVLRDLGIEPMASAGLSS